MPKEGEDMQIEELKKLQIQVKGLEARVRALEEKEVLRMTKEEFDRMK